MIKKPITMNHHGGEIAFPGGKIEKKDKSLMERSKKKKLILIMMRSYPKREVVRKIQILN